MKLAFTRAIIDAIHSGVLAETPVQRDPVFGVSVVTQCPDVPEEILTPRNTWADTDAFDRTARKLAGLFRENFTTYEAGVDASVRAAAPTA